MGSARVVGLLCILLLGGLLPPLVPQASAMDPPSPSLVARLPAIVPDQLLLGFVPESDEATREAIVASRGGATIARLDGVDARVVVIRAGRPLGEEARAYAAESAVRYAEPNYRTLVAAVPNDPQYADAGLWGLAKIEAPTAWDTTTGDRQIVVGVVDSGIDLAHPDLAANLWNAPAGWTLGGCAPGTHGYQSVTGAVGCDPGDQTGHGTQVAGTIGAVGDNGAGVVGVNWQVGLMALKCMAPDGTVQAADAVAVLNYAIAARQAGVGLRVLVFGWGMSGPSETLRAAIADAGAAGILVVAPAGDSGVNSANNDETPFYPANYGAAPYSLPNVLAVTATDQQDGLVTGSNIGPGSVHLGAPGYGILSTRLSSKTPSYQTYGGSAAAAAHVGGAAALVLAADPTLAVSALGGRLLACGTPREALRALTTTGRRLNVGQAVNNSGCDYRLTLMTPSNLEGSIAASPAAPTYPAGTVVTLTATATADYRFVGWEIDGVAAGAANPLAVTITADRTVAARFVRRTYTLILQSGGGGAVNANPAATTYQAGTVVQLTATPDAGYGFSGWTIDSLSAGNTQPYSLTMDGDHKVIAGFVPLATPVPTPVASPKPVYTLTLSAASGGGASALPSPGPYVSGTRVQVSATPNSGYVFTGWTVDGIAVGMANPYALYMNADRTAVATFARAHSLTLSSTSGGRAEATAATWAGGSPFPTGTVVMLTATTASNGVFTGWTIDGTFRGWASSLTLTMDAPHTVLATFAARPRFTDLPPGPPPYEAISQLAARKIVRGYPDGTFRQHDTILRAHMAALIGRAMGWEGEDHGNPFGDRGGVDDELWRAVGTLAYYEVARGYGNGTYGTLDPVLHVQTIAFITRAMVRQGHWSWQPDNPALFSMIPASTGHRSDLATYVHYVGPPPGTDPLAAWPAWDTPATRAWFASALWQALDGFYGTPRTP